MPVTILDAKAKLESEGLHVSCNNGASLWIAATVRDADGEIKFSEDACSLIEKSPRWVAVFPAGGSFTYEIPGSLPELIALIVTVYANYRRQGGSLNEAITQVVTDTDQYLIDRSPAHV